MCACCQVSGKSGRRVDGCPRSRGRGVGLLTEEVRRGERGRRPCADRQREMHLCMQVYMYIFSLAYFGGRYQALYICNTNSNNFFYSLHHDGCAGMQIDDDDSQDMCLLTKAPKACHPPHTYKPPSTIVVSTTITTLGVGK